MLLNQNLLSHKNQYEALVNTTKTTTQRPYICMIISKNSSFFSFAHFAAVLILPTTPEMICFAVVRTKWALHNQRNNSLCKPNPLKSTESDYINAIIVTFSDVGCRTSMFPMSSLLTACVLKVNIQFSGKRFCLLAKEQIWGFVQRRKWSPIANDPQTGNDPQIGPQMIPNRKWSPMWTANDPAGK